MTPSIYINLEDDVAKVVARIKREKNPSLILVCPKRCFLFNDSINLRLLKKQTELLNKEVFILTMDERGQIYAKEAGFGLKFLPQNKKAAGFTDIQRSVKPLAATIQPADKNTKNGQKKESQANKLTKGGFAAAEPIKTQAKDLIFSKEIETTYEARKRKISNQRKVFFLLGACLITAAVLIILVLPKAVLTVTAKSEPISRELSIGISVTNESVDVARLSMPAVKISEKLQVSRKFTAQGKKEIGNKASGLVRIYNFTKQPLNLKESTTSLILGNRTYKLVKDAMAVKPTIYKNQITKEVDESSLDAVFEIIATEGGESYNIPSGTRIEVTNQVFGSRPQFLYAKTETPIIGGTSRYLSVLSQLDLDFARNELGNDLITRLNENLKSRDLSVVEKAYSLENIEFITDKQIGSETPSFTANLTADVTALAFNLNQMNELVFERVKQTVPENKKVLGGLSQNLSYRLKSVDLPAASGVILANYSSVMVYELDLSGLKEKLTGKSRSKVQEILLSRPEVEAVEMILAPSWQNSFPLLKSRIEIKEENLEKN